MKLDFENQADDVRIELIPLIDVVFCILIFFILASLQLTRQQAISINLPQSSTSALQTRKSLMVSIDGAGNIYIDQQPVTEDTLYYTMQGFEQGNPEGLMVLYADRSATYDSVIQLLDLMRSVGGERVALATQQPQPGSGQSLIPGLSPNGTAVPPQTGNSFPGVPVIPGGAAPGASPGGAVPGGPANPFAEPGAVSSPGASIFDAVPSPDASEVPADSSNTDLNDLLLDGEPTLEE